jgi:DNA polymerase-1
MIEAFQKGMDLHQQTADLIGQPRSIAKNLNFGCVYGIGPKRFSVQAGLDFVAAQDILSNYFSTYSGLDEWLRSAARQATDARFTRTASGRLIRFNLGDGGDYHEVRKAASMVGRNGKNGPIQGTSADITKRAVRLVYENLRGTNSKIVNVVHDEIVVECDDSRAGDVAVRVKAVMEQAGSEFVSRVPILAETEISDRWVK